MLSKRLRIKKLVRNLKKERLFTVPSVLTELLKVSSDPLANAQDLALICEKDPTITARLLKTANSVYYGKANRGQIEQVGDAIVRIGFRKSEEIIMSATVCAALVTHRSSCDFSMWELWKHCYAVAICNRMISTHVFDKPDIDPFLAGLLHDIGIIIENQFLAEEGFLKATEQRQRQDGLLTDAETELLGFTHEELGLAVAKEWGFPAHIAAVVGHHHDLDVEDPRLRHYVHCTRMSEWICSVLQLGYADFGTAHADELMQSRSRLKLTDQDIDEVAKALTEEMDMLGSMGWFPYSSYKST